MKSRLFKSLAVAVALAFGPLNLAHAADEGSSIKFSDATKPGTLKVLLAHGNLRVKGADVSEVIVKSESKALTSKATRKDGLRVLSSASSYALTEKDNVVTLDAVSDGWRGGSGDFGITVPRNTRITVISQMGGSDINCADLDGDIDIKSVNGDIRLEGIGGAVLVESMNGDIRANMRELQANKALSFTSMHGQVTLRLPSDAKANLRLRTQNGTVLTDYDDKALVSKTENTPRPPSTKTRVTSTGRSGSKPGTPPLAPLAPAAAPGTPAPAAAPAAAPTPPDAPERIGLDEKDKAEIRRAAQETARAAQEAARAGQEIARDAMAMAKDAIQAARDGINVAVNIKGPNFSIPTISGGSLVTGTLNGGGTEINVATMNGDVIIRQLEKIQPEKK